MKSFLQSVVRFKSDLKKGSLRLSTRSKRFYSRETATRKNEVFIFGLNNINWGGDSGDTFIEPISFELDDVKSFSIGYTHGLAVTGMVYL